MEPLPIEVQLLEAGNLKELQALISVFEEVFEMEAYSPPSQSHLITLLKKDNFFAIIAKSQGKIIGGLTVYVIDQYYSERPLAHIYDLAVLSKFQRRGVGRRLIEFTISYCKDRGFEEVFVQAEKVDDYALDFYRSTTPTSEEEVVHYTYKLLGKL